MSLRGRTHSLGGERGGGVNILEDARHSSVLYICKYFVLQDILEDDIVKNILYLADLLEMCQFKIFWQQVSVLASSVDILVRIRIWYLWLMDPDSDLTPYFSDFKDAKKQISYFFFVTYPQAHYIKSLKNYFFAKILC